MNLGQMQAAILRDLIKTDDVNAEALTNSFRYVHRQLQLDFNWRTMYTRKTGLVYPAHSTDGIVIESMAGLNDCKHIIEVFLQSGGSLITLWPATQESASRDRRIAQIAQGQQPSEAAGWNQKWYDRGRRAALLIPPAADVTLTVDFYRFLPFYPAIGADTATLLDDPITLTKRIQVSEEDFAKFFVGQKVVLSTDATVVKTVTALVDADPVFYIVLNSVVGLADTNVLALGPSAQVDAAASDFFSENLPDAMQAGASYWLCKNIMKDDRAETFQANFVALVKMAYDSDRMSARGGLAESYSPPQPGQGQ